jgi:hypothetical protein
MADLDRSALKELAERRALLRQALYAVVDKVAGERHFNSEEWSRLEALRAEIRALDDQADALLVSAGGGSRTK